jgi:hypothetical protein
VNTTLATPDPMTCSVCGSAMWMDRIHDDFPIVAWLCRNCPACVSLDAEDVSEEVFNQAPESVKAGLKARKPNRGTYDAYDLVHGLVDSL